MPNAGIITNITGLDEESDNFPDGIKGIEFNDLHALHIAYGHYLKKQITNLEEKLESQSKEIESLKSELNSLKASTEV